MNVPDDLSKKYVRILAANYSGGVQLSCAELRSIIERIAALEAENARLSAPVTDARKKWWFDEWRPIINAIGEISVQEAMDAIERTL